ncbi:MAG: hypothetical protein SPF32_04945 [Lactobacillus johnsonii]|nr:hypothetical protein [Lactobacillus johnsonii]
MEKEHYYSKAFPTVVFPEDEKVLNYNYIDFQKALDVLFRYTDLQNSVKFFQRPMNLLIGNTKNELIIGINFDRAVLNYTALTTLKNEIESENVKNRMQKIAFEELGFNVNVFIELKISLFNKIFDNLVDQFKIFDDYFNHKNYLLQYYISKELDICIDSIKKQIKNVNYGGNGMWVNPIFKAKDISADPNLCFCVLPFNKNRLEIFDEVIKPTLEDNFKITVVRSGNIFKPNLNIMESIWTYINQASFVIADLSDRNPNVFYELGICHTLGKPVITLCDEKSYKDDYNEKLPFDINSINTIFYKNSGAGPTKLVNEIIKNVTAFRSGKPYIE